MPKRVYVVLPIGCDAVVAKMTAEAISSEYLHETPRLAWRARVARATITLDPTRYIVVGADLTGVVDERGAHVATTDWSDMHLAVWL